MFITIGAPGGGTRIGSPQLFTISSGSPLDYPEKEMVNNCADLNFFLGIGPEWEDLEPDSGTNKAPSRATSIGQLIGQSRSSIGSATHTQVPTTVMSGTIRPATRATYKIKHRTNQI